MIFLRLAIAIVLSFLPVRGEGRAAEFPRSTVPGIAGVNTGATTLGLDDQDYLRMREAGIRYVRFDLFWHQIEKAKGVYEWAAFDRVFAKLKAYELKPIIILDYGNKHYGPSTWGNRGGIRTDDARQAFANYAAAAVGRYNQQTSGIIWEVWNEPNSNGFWKPKRDPDEFMALIKAAVPAMRRADPTATIINGGILELFWNVTQAYLERCFELGLLDEVDGLGVHLYGGPRNIRPERIVRELADLRRRMVAHGARADFPVLNTEFGARLEEYKKAREIPPDKQELGQAETYVRMYLLCLLENVRLNVWYEWRWREGPSGHAVLNSDGSARVAYVAIATVNDQLNGYELERRIDSFGSDDFVLVFRKGNQRKLAVWTATEAHSIRIGIGTSATSFATTSMTGAAGSVEVQDGRVSAALTGSPMYIDLGSATPDR